MDARPNWMATRLQVGEVLRVGSLQTGRVLLS
jgi:hypothetical protein